MTSARPIAVLLAVTLAGCAPAVSSPPSLSRSPSQSNSAGLSPAELSSLRAGRVVSRPMALEERGARYVGGVSYALVRAAPEEILAPLENVRELPQALPNTLSARFVGGTSGRERVDLVQGNSVVRAEYTVVIERARNESKLRFWLDRSRPHDIDDLWGYVRVQPFDTEHSLVTVAALLDMGPGLGRLLFEGRVQRTILRTPEHIRDFVEQSAIALR